MQIAAFCSSAQRHDGAPCPQRARTTAQVQHANVPNQDSPRETRALQRRQAGGTLIEVVVATAIIAIMAAGLISSLGYGFMVTQLARENQRATQVLLEKAEVIRLYNWDQYNYTNNFVPTNFTAVYDPQSPTNSQGITYYGTLAMTSGTTTLTNHPSYASNLIQITISLNWITNGRIPHSRMLTTQIAKDGLQNYVY